MGVEPDCEALCASDFAYFKKSCCSPELSIVRHVRSGICKYNTELTILTLKTMHSIHKAY
jgi:hypothetical protein